MEDTNPWALNALRLVFSVPRTYTCLAQGWDARYPGTLRTLASLTKAGFIDFQDPIIVDVRTGKLATRCSPPVARYKVNAKGRRLCTEIAQDIKVVVDTFSRVNNESIASVAALIQSLNLDANASKYGISITHIAMLTSMPERSVRWWVNNLIKKGFVVTLKQKLADVREVVPGHYRVTKKLCQQLNTVCDSLPDNLRTSLKVEFRLDRTKFLQKIEPARIGITGATDYDHDIETQKLLTALIGSPRCGFGGIFNVEPRLNLPVFGGTDLFEFDPKGDLSVFYQPDAELREIHSSTSVVSRSIVEFERFQSRRDAWSHIERFLGWLHCRALISEPAVLRFVVDTESRVQSYVELIEAFADHMLDNPHLHPGNDIQLAVSSMERILQAADPLAEGGWFRVNLIAPSADIEHRPVLHVNITPYDTYFKRSG